MAERQCPRRKRKIRWLKILRGVHRKGSFYGVIKPPRTSIKGNATNLVSHIRARIEMVPRKREEGRS